MAYPLPVSVSLLAEVPPIDGFSVCPVLWRRRPHRLDGFDIKLLRGYSQATDRNFWKFTGVRDCAGQNRTGEQ